MRAITVAIASVLAGTAGAAATASQSAFVIGFCFLFWAVIVASVLLLAKGRRGDVPKASNREPEDPWCDAIGVRRFPGDVLDVENHPRPGAHGRN